MRRRTLPAGQGSGDRRNITKCRTKVCPEHITITDNAIIPLKVRVVDRFHDPVKKLLRVCSQRSRSLGKTAEDNPRYFLNA